MAPERVNTSRPRPARGALGERARARYPHAVVNVLYFAACRERTGLSHEAVELEGKTVADAVAALVERHPRLTEVASRCRVAINARFVAADAVVPAGAELVLIPPVAGG